LLHVSLSLHFLCCTFNVSDLCRATDNCLKVICARFLSIVKLKSHSITSHATNSCGEVLKHMYIMTHCFFRNFLSPFNFVLRWFYNFFFGPWMLHEARRCLSCMLIGCVFYFISFCCWISWLKNSSSSPRVFRFTSVQSMCFITCMCISRQKESHFYLLFFFLDLATRQIFFVNIFWFFCVFLFFSFNCLNVQPVVI
jgi:hypothetical protein